MIATNKIDPTRIPRHRKQKYLSELSERDFGDYVVRPLMLRRGMKDGRDLCGPTEEGKDIIFVNQDPMGFKNVYAVQTKKGDINLAAKANRNLITALTQVQTALETSVVFLGPRESQKPTKVILCASGRINEAARKHIAAEISDPRIEFLDMQELIPQIDEQMPEFWFGVSTDKFSYLNSLIELLTKTVSIKGSGDDDATAVFSCPVSNASFAPLRANRIRIVNRKVKGQYVQVPKFEEMSISKLVDIKEKNIILLGDAGSGKSTALRRVVFSIAERSLLQTENVAIPVLTRAIELVSENIDLVDLIATVTSDISPTRSVAFDAKDLNEGLVVVVVDGLDEVASQASRQSVINKIIQFRQNNPACRVILSSRQYAWLNSLEGIGLFERFHVSPIDWKQTTKIIRRVRKGRSLPENKAKELLRRLQEIHGMQLNPLLVTAFVASSDFNRTDIPANITELFKKFTEMMLGRWDANKGFAQQHHAPLKDFLLRQLAKRMHRRKVTYLGLHELKESLTHELLKRGKDSDTASLIEEMVHRSGLFRILSSEHVEFSHMLLQEFFAGRGLEETEVSSLISDEWWQRCLVFYFGEHPDKHSVLEDVTSLLQRQNGSQLARSSLALGLGLQACYLLTIDKKTEIFSHVVDGLSRATVELFAGDGPLGSKALLPFIQHYVVGRDSVACDVLRISPHNVREKVEELSTPAYLDYCECWQIVGLLECGNFKQAMERLWEFHPAEARLLLPLHLSAYLYLELRLSDKSEKRDASKVVNFLEPKISHFRKELRRQFDSELFEIRKGKLRAIRENTER